MDLPTGWRESCEQRDDGDHAIVVLFPGLYGVQIAWNGMKALLQSVTLHIG
jgi:hypothetical protein